MRKPTGPGKFTEYFFLRNDQECWEISLYNFDIDGDELKPEHRACLNEKVVPRLNGLDYHVWVQGGASRSGGADYNLALSKRRANNSADFLASRGIPEGKMQREWVGSLASNPKLLENEADRVVHLRIQPATGPAPPPTPPELLPATDRFLIRALGDPSLEVQSFWLRGFEILDPLNQLGGYYAGPNQLMPAPASLSVWYALSLRTPWAEFRTPRKLTVRNFQDLTRLDFGPVGTYDYVITLRMKQGAVRATIVVGRFLYVERDIWDMRLSPELIHTAVA